MIVVPVAGRYRSAFPALQRDDYDSPRKALLDRWHQRFFEFFFPVAAADIDWSRGLRSGPLVPRKRAPIWIAPTRSSRRGDPNDDEGQSGGPVFGADHYPASDRGLSVAVIDYINTMTKE